MVGLITIITNVDKKISAKPQARGHFSRFCQEILPMTLWGYGISHIVQTMKATHAGKTGITTTILFDVADSSALERLSIGDNDYSSGRKASVHIIYKSNPEATYLYQFDGLEAIADLYLAIMGQDSAGKFATYVRNNADSVSKHVDGNVEFLPARKTLNKEGVTA